LFVYEKSKKQNGKEGRYLLSDKWGRQKVQEGLSWVGRDTRHIEVLGAIRERKESKRIGKMHP